jgi:hypothetical protein
LLKAENPRLITSCQEIAYLEDEGGEPEDELLPAKGKPTLTPKVGNLRVTLPAKGEPTLILMIKSLEVTIAVSGIYT